MRTAEVTTESCAPNLRGNTNCIRSLAMSSKSRNLDSFSLSARTFVDNRESPKTALSRTESKKIKTMSKATMNNPKLYPLNEVEIPSLVFPPASSFLLDRPGGHIREDGAIHGGRVPEVPPARSSSSGGLQRPRR